MNVLSLFDGISCGQVALKKSKIKVSKYFAAEINLPSIKVTQKNFPATIQLGDVRYIKAKNLPKIDLLLAGSPCQGFSNTGTGLNFDHPESKLFFEFIRILRECKKANPKLKYLLENVVMKKEWEEIISKEVGVEPIKINSALFSAQSRSRLYWTNLKIPKLPAENSKECINDILEKKDTVKTSKIKFLTDRSQTFKQTLRVHPAHGKSPTLMAGEGGALKMTVKVATGLKTCRVLTVTEWERLQGLPDKYTLGQSETKRRSAIGNGWQVDTIVHIFKGLK